jgi:hypothetical protein
VLKKKLLLVLAVLLPSYSYSDSIKPYYGNTGNAAASGLTWDMGNILPEPPGLDINAVIYNYTIQKQVEDAVTVNVQNENALGAGYIFRETDEWKPGSLGGTEINKVVGVPDIPREYWGDGSIDVQGNGSVTDARVVYSYRVDPCYDPQFDPSCPGYKVEIPEIPEVDLSSIYDATNDPNVNLNRTVDDDLIEKKDLEEEADEEAETEEEKDSKERLEKALSAADNSAMFAQALANAQMLDAMNLATNMNAYYQSSIPGGTYAESVVLPDKQLPENRNGLRNGLAQQLLHEKMIEQQYK